jgi:hypothetical protein
MIEGWSVSMTLNPPIAAKRNSTHGAFSPIEGTTPVHAPKLREYGSNDMRPAELKAALFFSP